MHFGGHGQQRRADVARGDGRAHFHGHAMAAQVGGDVGARMAGRLRMAGRRVQQGQHYQARRAQEGQGVADGARRFHAAIPGHHHGVVDFRKLAAARHDQHGAGRVEHHVGHQVAHCAGQCLAVVVLAEHRQVAVAGADGHAAIFIVFDQAPFQRDGAGLARQRLKLVQRPFRLAVQC